MGRGENLRAAFFGLLVYLGLVAALLYSTSSREDELRTRGAGSSRATTERGLARLHEVLAAEGIPVTRLEEPGGTPPDTTVLIVEPVSKPDPELVFDLVSVVRNGEATLVAAGSSFQLEKLSLAFELGEIPPTTTTDAPVPVAIEGAPVALYSIGLDVATEPDPALDDPDPRTFQAFSDAPAGFDVLVAAADGSPVIVTRPFGHGFVVLLSEPRILENSWIEARDNVEMALTLLGGRRRVAFDDRWQRRSEGVDRSSEMMALVYGTGPGRAMVFLLLTAFFVAYLAGLFPGGPARRRTSPRRPTAYVDALAELQLSARGGAHVLQHFQDRFARRAIRVLGLPPDIDRQTLAARIATRVPDSEKEVLDLLTRRVSSRQVPGAVRALDRLQRVLGK